MDAATLKKSMVSRVIKGIHGTYSWGPIIVKWRNLTLLCLEKVLSTWSFLSDYKQTWTKKIPRQHLRYCINHVNRKFEEFSLLPSVFKVDSTLAGLNTCSSVSKMVHLLHVRPFCDNCEAHFSFYYLCGSRLGGVQSMQLALLYSKTLFNPVVVIDQRNCHMDQFLGQSTLNLELSHAPRL